MTLFFWIALIVIVAALAVAGAVVRRRRRRARLRWRQRRVLDELDGIGVDEVELFVEPSSGGDLKPVGPARVLQEAGVLTRRGTAFFVAPEERGTVIPSDRPLILRLTRAGVSHELRCRLEGRSKVTGRARKLLGGSAQMLLRLTPAGVIVKRERRDMMRFFVGDRDQGTPRGTTDARRFMDLEARLQSTDLDVSGEQRMPRVLGADAFDTIDHDANGPVPEGGWPVTVIDFSGTGLRVETDMESMAHLVAMPPDEAPEAIFSHLDERALLVRVRVTLRFPPRVEELEPLLPRSTAMLAEVARVSLLEDDGEPTGQVRLGLALLYQPKDIDEATEQPVRWELIKGQGEADDFVAIHNALNQAAAQMQSESP